MTCNQCQHHRVYLDLERDLEPDEHGGFRVKGGMQGRLFCQRFPPLLSPTLPTHSCGEYKMKEKE